MSEAVCPQDISSSALAPDGYREAYLAVFIVFLLVTVLGIASFIKARKRSGRLAKRSLVLVCISGAAVALSAIAVFFREYYGRESFPCIIILVFHNLVIPLSAGPLVAKVYVHAYRLRKSQVRAGLSFAAVKKEQDRIDRGEKPAGQGLAQDLSALLTLQSKTRPSGETNKSKDQFEVVSPVIGGFDVSGDDDDSIEAFPSATLSAASPESMSPSITNKLRQASSSDARGLDVIPADEKAIQKRSFVEYMPSVQSSSSLTPSPQRPKGKKGQSITEDIMRKASGGRQSSSGYMHPRNSRLSSYAGVGWWNPKAQESEAEVHLEELIRHESSWFGFFMVALISIPFIAVIVVRVITDKTYTSGCLGCGFSNLDMYILCGLTLLVMAVFAFSVVTMWNSPDPLGILWEAKFCVFIFCILGSPTVILYLLDPSDIEKNYRFTWFAFEAIAVLLIFVVQTFGQVALTQWANTRIPKNISLLRLLENVELRDMFDDHLTSEFSIENLRFWDRAIHWKVSYEHMSPDEIQRKARDLYQVFIQPDAAAMELNLSSQNMSRLVAAFSPDVPEPVSRKVFDAALKECYKLMNDGLARFLVSEKYRAFIKHAPDFEGDMLRNKEVGLDVDVTIDKYLEQLETLQRPSVNAQILAGLGNSNQPPESPRKSSRPSFSFLRPHEHQISLASSKEDDEDDEEMSRPISMRVRKSVAGPQDSPIDRRRSSYAQNYLNPQRRILGESSSKVEPHTDGSSNNLA